MRDDDPAGHDERSVLIIDDDDDHRRRVATHLQAWGYVPLALGSAEEALERVGRTRFAFALVAIRLPGLSGIEFLRRARDLNVSGPVIMVADSTHSAQIAEATQAGADGFIRRHSTAEELATVVKSVAGRPRPAAPRTAAETNGARLEREMSLLTSPAMREIRGILGQAARADVTVLIGGETGVGKERVAHAIHAQSARSQRAFVKVDCAAMPRELLESELFGHERGAFTGAHERMPGRFERADGGTIFLDEIGELPWALQAKLLHVLQDGEFSRVGGADRVAVDVRVIAATSRNLGREVAAGRFREDLFYRLNVINVLVPPLRERMEEIPALARYFVEHYSRAFSVPERPLPAETMRAFLDYGWPGNIRELENFIKRMIVLQDMTLVPRRPVVLESASPGMATAPVAGRSLSLKEISRRAVLEVEREVIRRTLDQCRWNRVKTAKMLNISYRALLYKIKDMGLRQDSAAS